MNGEIGENIKEEAWTICKDFLGGTWKTISLEDFRIYEVRGGLSNTLYRCVLPETAVGDSREPREVLLRIYGPIQDDPSVIVREAVAFILLSERKLGPRLYGFFPKGRLEEFIPSHNLNTNEMRKYSLQVARELAKVHALDVPLRKVPDMFRTYGEKWLSEVRECLETDEGRKFFLSYSEYIKEMDWLEKEMAKSNSPVVYCHNDLQQGNILYREDMTENGQPNLMLIDFEFGSYNYRGFDLANHFCEWCFEYSTPEFPHFRMDLNRFPSKEEQTEFFNAYFDQLLKEGVLLQQPTKQELQVMLTEIPLFASAVHLLWSLWSAKMVVASTDGFPYGEHGKTRSKLFHVFKEQYLASKREGILQ